MASSSAMPAELHGSLKRSIQKRSLSTGLQSGQIHGGESATQQPIPSQDNYSGVRENKRRTGEDEISSPEPAPFVKTLFDLLETGLHKRCIDWDHTGEHVVFLDQDTLCTTVLPQYFRHDNIASFSRQLNIHNFTRSKMKGLSNAYTNPYFKRGHSELLHLIKRKKETRLKRAAQLKAKEKNIQTLHESIRHLQHSIGELDQRQDKLRMNVLAVLNESTQHAEFRYHSLQLLYSRAAVSTAISSVSGTQASGPVPSPPRNEPMTQSNTFLPSAMQIQSASTTQLSGDAPNSFMEMDVNESNLSVGIGGFGGVDVGIEDVERDNASLPPSQYFPWTFQEMIGGELQAYTQQNSSYPEQNQSISEQNQSYSEQNQFAFQQFGTFPPSFLTTAVVRLQTDDSSPGAMLLNQRGLGADNFGAGFPYEPPPQTTYYQGEATPALPLQMTDFSDTQSTQPYDYFRRDGPLL